MNGIYYSKHVPFSAVLFQSPLLQPVEISRGLSLFETWQVTNEDGSGDGSNGDHGDGVDSGGGCGTEPSPRIAEPALIVFVEITMEGMLPLRKCFLDRVLTFFNWRSCTNISMAAIVFLFYHSLPCLTQSLNAICSEQP